MFFPFLCEVYGRYLTCLFFLLEVGDPTPWRCAHPRGTVVLGRSPGQRPPWGWDILLYQGEPLSPHTNNWSWWETAANGILRIIEDSIDIYTIYRNHLAIAAMTISTEGLFTEIVQGCSWIIQLVFLDNCYVPSTRSAEHGVISTWKSKCLVFSYASCPSEQ